jgi:hypothetical protein
MAGGGLMQLVAYGAQDVYLSGKPEITFFKAVYKRHTNFAIECIPQTFLGNPGSGKTVSCPLTRNGDLVTNMVLKCDISGTAAAQGAGALLKPAPYGNWSWCDNVGFALIDNVELEIGGSKIDRHYGDWMYVWHSLTNDGAHDDAHNAMIGHTDAMRNMDRTTHADTLYVPLQFFCCRNNGLALPLIALQYHDVRLNFTFSKLANIVNYIGAVPTDLTLANVELLVDYVFLDTDERKRFAQSSHEYLIEQVQFTGDETVKGTNENIKLNFNHPCKALVWYVRPDEHTDSSKKWLHWDKNHEKALELSTKIFCLEDSTIYTTLGLAGSVLPAGYKVLGWDNPSTAAPNSDVSRKVHSTLGTLEMVKVTGEDSTVMQGDYKNNTDALRNDSYSLFDFDDFVLTTPGLTEMTRPSANANAVFANFNAVVQQPFYFGSKLIGGENVVDKALLQLNGQERFKQMSGAYFNYVQPYQHFSNRAPVGVNVYSFALNPGEHQPSGSCNFSRIDNAQLVLELNSAITNTTQGTLKVYAVNYNVLRIMSGMGGLAYSN